MQLRYELLPDRPEYLETVCRWYLEEWGRNKDTLDSLIKRIGGRYLESRRIPLMVLALKRRTLVGVYQIKFREMKIFPEYEHWLGGVFVLPEHRGQGTGEAIVGHALEMAIQQSVRTLYLQTEHLSGGLYARMGWESVKQVEYGKKTVMVMKKNLR